MIEVVEGDGPVILGLPHTGTDVPPEILDCLNKNGRQLADTDWYIHRLYDGLLPDATTVRTPIHRYAIDVNRDPAGESLYPGQNTTSLCPLSDFDGAAIWSPGAEPDDAEIERRRLAYHTPYHAALAEQVRRVRERHGIAIVYDCHSIRSRIPYLFEGVLPDFNIGTFEGAACDPAMEKVVVDICGSAVGYTSVLNGRFKGGWTTRHYGRLGDGVHALQMELAQSTHLVSEQAPFDYDEQKAERVRVILSSVLAGIARKMT